MLRCLRSSFHDSSAAGIAQNAPRAAPGTSLARAEATRRSRARSRSCPPAAPALTARPGTSCSTATRRALRAGSQRRRAPPRALWCARPPRGRSSERGGCCECAAVCAGMARTPAACHMRPAPVGSDSTAARWDTCGGVPAGKLHGHGARADLACVPQRATPLCRIQASSSAPAQGYGSEGGFLLLHSVPGFPLAPLERAAVGARMARALTPPQPRFGVREPDHSQTCAPARTSSDRGTCTCADS